MKRQSASPPRQERSRQTAERFVMSALQLLKTRTFSELAVADIAAGADRSVGAFYQRFGSKDDFLEYLLEAFFEGGCAGLAEMEVGPSASATYASVMRRSYEAVLANRNLWHAALQRSAAEPGFWARFDAVRQRIATLSLAVIERSAAAPLDEAARQRIAAATQVFNSVINNQIINAPGPLRLEDREFLPRLQEIALQIAALDERPQRISSR